MDMSKKYEYNHQVFRLPVEVLISGYSQRNSINPFKAHNQFQTPISTGVNRPSEYGALVKRFMEKKKKTISGCINRIQHVT